MGVLCDELEEGELESFNSSMSILDIRDLTAISEAIFFYIVIYILGLEIQSTTFGMFIFIGDLKIF